MPTSRQLMAMPTPKPMTILKGRGLKAGCFAALLDFSEDVEDIILGRSLCYRRTKGDEDPLAWHRGHIALVITIASVEESLVASISNVNLIGFLQAAFHRQSFPVKTNQSYTHS